MAKLFGAEYTRKELLARVGDISQLCAARPVALRGGRSDGVEAVEFATGSGLSFRVLPGRGLDIEAASYRGASLCWHSATGVTAPAYHEPEGDGWLRGFYGGLLVTCGLTYAGAPCRDGGRELGLHGRASNTPAENVWVDGTWEGDDYRVWVQGKVREAAVFGENVVMTRRISAMLGESRIQIEDSVENLGHEQVEHMMLYHINLGFPLVDEGAELIAPSRAVMPRDEEAARGSEEYARCSGPAAGYREKVYYHDLAAGRVALVNKAFGAGEGLGVRVAFDRRELPVLVQWKMMGRGCYTMGIEPANCRVAGRDAERRAGTLQFLAPGETRNYRLAIEVVSGAAELRRVEDEIRFLGRTGQP